MDPNGQLLTPDQAIAAVRSTAKQRTTFQILRELPANAGTRRIAEQSLQDAMAGHIRLFGDGILTDVLARGAFLIAEIDSRTNNLAALHLVSAKRNSRPACLSYPSEFGVKIEDAAKLVQATADFTRVLLSTPSSDDASLEDRFLGGAFPEYDNPWEGGYFTIPRSLVRIGADQRERGELAALYGGSTFWLYRYALSLPAYAANPLTARQAADQKHKALEAQFLRNDVKGPDFLYAPQYSKSVGEVRERIDLLRRLDEFLEETLKKDAVTDVVEANESTATIPLQVEGVRRGGDTFFVSTASGIVIYWERLTTGAFAVKDVSEVEAEQP
jgi:hypothetical protein